MSTFKHKSRFLACLGRVPRLARHETTELIAKAQYGDRYARHTVILAWLPYAVMVNRSICKFSEAEDDLDSELYLIMEKCINRYVPEKGSWPTYIRKSIRNQYHRYLEKNCYPVRLPGDSLLADRSDASFLAAMAPPISDEEHTIASNSAPPEKQIDDDDESNFISSILFTLKPDVREIFVSYFGIGGVERESAAKIGLRFGVTRQAILTRIAYQVEKLRGKFAADYMEMRS